MALVCIFLGVVLLWALCLGFGVLFFPSWELRGQFGDLFGAVNALFSGLAFAGLIFSPTEGAGVAAGRAKAAT